MKVLGGFLDLVLVNLVEKKCLSVYKVKTLSYVLK